MHLLKDPAHLNVYYGLKENKNINFVLKLYFRNKNSLLCPAVILDVIITKMLYVFRYPEVSGRIRRNPVTMGIRRYPEESGGIR